MFHLLNDESATREIRKYFQSLVEIAVKHRVGMILCGLHYRASRDSGNLLGYSTEGLAEINRKGIDLFQELAGEYENEDTKIVSSGCIGPRGDAYELNNTMTSEEARDYHSEQIATLDAAGADMITALTFNDAVQAVKDVGIPVVVTFTVDVKGRLQTGLSLEQAIETVDIETDATPLYYMINCAHPIDLNRA